MKITSYRIFVRNVSGSEFSASFGQDIENIAVYALDNAIDVKDNEILIKEGLGAGLQIVENYGKLQKIKLDTTTPRAAPRNSFALFYD